MQRYPVTKQSAGSSLVDFLAATRECSLRKAKALLDARCVFVNGRRVWMAKHRLKQADVVEVHEAHAAPSPARPGIDILWQNADYLVVNKPPGLLSNGANSAETRLNESRSSSGGNVRAVHRLDKDTSGCLCLAKSARAFDQMVEHFRAGEITKVYEAVVHGALERGLSITKPIDELPATTHVQVLRAAREITHLRVRIDTGRTHQIRKHLAQVGHPIVGDRQYCTLKLTDQRFRQVPRQLLHASTFTAPLGDGNQPVTVKAPLPPDFAAALKRLRLR